MSPAKRRRLERQGFVGLDEALLAEVEPWVRFTPAVCALLIGLGTALRSWPLLGALVPIAGLGALFPAHSFDLVYNYGLRHLTGTRPLPPNGAPRRVACGMASAWLAATALMFKLDATLAGYILGSALTMAIAIVNLSHFCIASTIYYVLFGRRAGSRTSSL